MPRNVVEEAGPTVEVRSASCGPRKADRWSAARQPANGTGKTARSSCSPLVRRLKPHSPQVHEVAADRPDREIQAVSWTSTPHRDARPDGQGRQESPACWPGA